MSFLKEKIEQWRKGIGEFQEQVEEIEERRTEEMGRKTKVEVVREYGMGLETIQHWLRAEDGDLAFDPTGRGLGRLAHAEKDPRVLDADHIDFENISISSERDFDAENANRGINYLSFTIPSDMPTKKQRDYMVTIPARESNSFMVVKPLQGVDDLLTVISNVDPTTQTALTESK